jgi:hypothetical protein
MSRYTLVPHTFLRHTFFDLKLEFNTLVYSHRTTKNYRVNKTGYYILNYISNSEQCTLEEISNYLIEIKIAKNSPEAVKKVVKNYLEHLTEIGVVDNTK